MLRTDIAVIGGGIVGLAIAAELQRSGRNILVIDPHPASGATFAAAGMLAPVSELHYQEEELLELMVASATRWPDFVAPLVAPGLPDPGFQKTPTLVVGADAADREALLQLRDTQLRLDLDVEQLSIRQARAKEPLLAPQLSCAMESTGDHQVDPRAMAAALIQELSTTAATRGALSPLVAHAAGGLLHSDPADFESPVVGVRLAGGEEVTAGEVIVANGLGAADLAGLPARLNLPLRPVYGDILRLKVPAHLRPFCTATIRGMVRGLPVYIVPRADNTVVIGATSREDGQNGVSAGGVHQLLRDAAVLIPAVAELELIEMTARARPGTPDNAPVIGRVSDLQGSEIPGLIVATGLYRHGVLLSAITAQICRELTENLSDSRWRAFRADRFADVVLHSANRITLGAS